MSCRGPVSRPEYRLEAGSLVRQASDYAHAVEIQPTGNGEKVVATPGFLAKYADGSVDQGILACRVITRPV